MKINKVMILGSNSFTGSHFVDYLLENTVVEVVGISRSPEYDNVFLPYRYRKTPEKFTFHQLDMNNDFEKLKKLLDEENPDVIVNYAAQGEVRNSWKWPEQWFETNCMGVVKLGNFLKDKEYLKKYIAISTPEVYGSTEKNMKENSRFSPSTPYAASKLAGDLFMFTLHKKYDFPVSVTRSANVYGIHQQLYRIIPRTIIYLKLGKKIQLHGGGKAVRSFIHVRDAADAVWKAVNGQSGEVYHLAPENEEISIRELVRVICEIMGYDFPSSTKDVDENFGQDAVYSLDSRKAKEELGWKPQITLKNGINEMIDWIEENWEIIKNKPLEYVHKP